MIKTADLARVERSEGRATPHWARVATCPR